MVFYTAIERVRIKNKHKKLKSNVNSCCLSRQLLEGVLVLLQCHSLSLMGRNLNDRIQSAQPLLSDLSIADFLERYLFLSIEFFVVGLGRFLPYSFTCRR